MVPVDYLRDFEGIGPLLRQPSSKVTSSSNSLINGYSYHVGYAPGFDLDYVLPDYESNEIDPLNNKEDENFENVDISIKGRRDDDGIFLRLRLADKEGYFHFKHM